MQRILYGVIYTIRESGRATGYFITDDEYRMATGKSLAGICGEMRSFPLSKEQMMIPDFWNVLQLDFFRLDNNQMVEEFQSKNYNNPVEDIDLSYEFPKGLERLDLESGTIIGGPPKFRVVIDGTVMDGDDEVSEPMFLDEAIRYIDSLAASYADSCRYEIIKNVKAEAAADYEYALADLEAELSGEDLRTIKDSSSYDVLPDKDGDSWEIDQEFDQDFSHDLSSEHIEYTHYDDGSAELEVESDFWRFYLEEVEDETES